MAALGANMYVMYEYNSLVLFQGDDGELDYRGLGAANCAFELKRRGIEGLSDPELHVFCKIYLKLKCAKMLH